MKKKFYYYCVIILHTKIPLLAKSLLQSASLSLSSNKKVFSHNNQNLTKSFLDPFFIELIKQNKIDYIVPYLISRPEVLTLHAKESGRTILHCAIEFNKFEIVELILEYQEDINCRDNDGATPLHYAARDSNLSMLQLILQKGGKIHDVDDCGASIMHYCVTNQHHSEEIFLYLISKGLNVNSLDYTKASPLHYASRTDNVSIIKTLAACGANLFSYDAYGQTALHHAASSYQLYAQPLLYLIDEGLSIDEPDNAGNRPIHHAALNNQTSQLFVLCKKTSYIDLPNAQGFTPLCYAILNSNRKMTDLLLSKGANANLHVMGKPLLLMAIYSCPEKDIGIIEQLIKHGANTSSLYKGKTAYCYALELGKFSFAEIIKLTQHKNVVHKILKNKKKFAKSSPKFHKNHNPRLKI